jgi:hypothetical protein
LRPQNWGTGEKQLKSGKNYAQLQTPQTLKLSWSIPGLQKIPFKICGWIGFAIYCFFHELEVISACFPVDMSTMTGAQRPVADDTLLKKLWMSFLPLPILFSKWFE